MRLDRNRLSQQLRAEQQRQFDLAFNEGRLEIGRRLGIDSNRALDRHRLEQYNAELARLDIRLKRQFFPRRDNAGGATFEV